MAYVHCQPARVLAMRHGMDNVVTGTIRTSDDEMLFRTRGHIVKATNRIYRNASWKPDAGSDVLIDGEVGPSGMIIDHMEADMQCGDAAHSPHLDVIAAKLPKHPPASATLRVWRSDGIHRLRFANPITGTDRRGSARPGILHASFDPVAGTWRLWTVARDGGELVSDGIDAHVLAALAAEAGFDVSPPEMPEVETGRDKGARARRMRMFAVDDDVPF